MLLVVAQLLAAKLVLVHHFLQLEKGSRFVPANVAQVIGATTTQRYQFGVFKLGYINLIVSVIGIILNPEGNRIKQFVILNKLYIADGMYFLAPAYHFVGAVIVNVFN